METATTTKPRDITQLRLQQDGAGWSALLGDYNLTFGTNPAYALILHRIHQEWQRGQESLLSDGLVHWSELERVLNSDVEEIPSRQPLLARMLTSRSGRIDRVMHFVDGIASRIRSQCFDDWKLMTHIGAKGEIYVKLYGPFDARPQTAGAQKVA